MKTQRGFTLIETLVALVMLAIMLMGVTAHTMTTLNSLAQGKNMAAAINLAERQLEQFRKTVPTGTSGSVTNLTETGASGGIYSVNWTAANGPATGLKDVTVTTQWTDKLGTHSYRLRSFL